MEQDIFQILKSFLEPLVKAMVDFPDETKVNIQKSEFNTVFIYITGKKSDIGKLIGREGRHAEAIRLLTSSVGSKLKHRTIVEINSE